MASDSFSGSDQEHYTFLYGHTKHNRKDGGKEQTNKHRLGLAPSAREGSLWHVCAALRAFAGYHGSVFCAELPQNHLGCWLISRLPCFHLLTASFCWVCPSLDSYLKPTVLFCPPLSTALSVFSKTFLLSFASGLVLRPFLWVLHQNRLTDPLSGANTNGNEIQPIVSPPSSSSSSSSCRAASTDIPDPLSPLLPIVHRLWQIFRATSRILI